MFSALENLENSRAFWIFYVIAFPLLFAAIWSLVLGITSWMSGWRHLSKRYRFQNEQVIEWRYRGGGGVYRTILPFAGMRGQLAVGVNKEGYVIKPPLVFRPFHPILFLPFHDIKIEEDRKFLMLDLVIMTMTDAPDIRIAILKSVRDMADMIRAA